MHSFTPNTRIKSEQVNENFDDVASGVADTDNNRSQLYRAETCFDFVQSGLIWSVVSGLNLSMTAGVAYIANASNIMDRIVVAQITSRAFTASKDTYVDLGADGTIYYSEVANGATAPSLSSYRIRIALVVTGASSVTEIFQTNQRQANTTLTDSGWGGLDNLGNPVRNTNPYQMEFRVTRHNGTGTRSTIAASGTATELPNMGFNYKTGRSKEKIIFEIGCMFIFSAVAGNHQLLLFLDGNSQAPMIYTEKPVSQWTTHNIPVQPVYRNENTTIAVSLRALQNQTVQYVNAATSLDQAYTMPTVIIKVTKAGT